MVDKAIIPECYIDTGLIEILVPTKVGYNHQKGCSNVVREMKASNFLKDGFALGIVDKDKKQLDYLAECTTVDEIAGWLILWKHKEKHHYFIQICPEVEEWIRNIADELQIRMAEFDLPSDLVNFCKLSKKVTASDNARFVGLFKEIKRKGKDNNKVKKLVHWITILKEKSYEVTFDELKADN